MNAFDLIGRTTLAVFNSRKAAGYPLKVCLGLAPLKEELYELDGEIFESLKEVAAKHGIALGLLKSRLYRMSLEEALNFYNSSGRYNTKTFLKHPELANVPAVLYLVVIDFKTGPLHKIGVTTRNLESRFQEVDFKNIFSIKGPLYQLYQIEQELLREFQQYRKKPNDDFCGKSETFLFSPAEEAELKAAILQKAAEQLDFQKVA